MFHSLKPIKKPLFVASLLLLAVSTAHAQDITVHADRVLHTVSPYLAGACLEDVNHEVYGGIYSQMLFGESFQEPATSPPKGFRILGGNWNVRNDELTASGVPGDKIVSQFPAFTNGEVGIEVFIPDRQTTNVGLIVRVGEAGAGMDNFDGYEISLNAAAQHVLLGRHRHNWERIKDTPCEIPIGQWVPLSVKLNDRTIEISVNGKSVVNYVDDDKALLSGTIGIRQFQKEAKYRKFWIKTDGEAQPIDFVASIESPPGVSGMWRAVQKGEAHGTFSLETTKPFVGQHSQRMTFIDGQGEVGIENQGLNRWGLHFEKRSPYEVTIWARVSEPTEIHFALQNRDGSQTVAHTMQSVRPPADANRPDDWQEMKVMLIPSATVERGRFVISLRKPGTVDLGYALLQPDKNRFQGLPVRRDVAEGLINQGIRVLRYGGSMVNHPEYRWMKMVGSRAHRPPYVGHWYPYSTNGWGIPEFLDFCDAAKFVAIPTFNMDETPDDMTRFIFYANMPGQAGWGRKRVEAGHPEPYQLRYIELGNEERVDDQYYEKFEKLAETIWKCDPKMTIVVGDFVYSEVIRNPFNFRGAASGITTLAAHQKILKLAKQHKREVWFDLHVGTDGPRPDSTLAATLSFIDALEKIADGAKFKVVVFELNAGNHSQRRALANAIAINAFARDGRVPMVLAANCLQPDGQNDNDWNQGLLFLNQSQVWLQPPGYVTQLVSSHYQPKLVQCDVTKADNSLDVLSTISKDGQQLVIQAVNPTDRFVTSRIEFKGFTPKEPVAKVTELAGPLASVNTATQPTAITPQSRKWYHDRGSYTFPPHSVTMIKVE